MKLYYWPGAFGGWQLPGQQDKRAEKVDVPTDAAGLCAWLNERRVPICLSNADPGKSAEQAYGFDPTGSSAGDPAPRATEPTSLQSKKPADDPTCPRCKWSHNSAERYAQQMAKSAQTDARIEWIEEEADAWTLGRLAGAVAVRFDKMKGGD